jgi:predicted kinase
MEKRRVGSQNQIPERVLTIPERALVMLIGASGSGKSSFARKHFQPSQVVSSDYCRALVCDDEADQGATRDAFDLLHYIVGKRLAYGKLTVVDATNVEANARRSLLSLAREYRFAPVAIVLDIGEDAALRQNFRREERKVPTDAVRSQYRELQTSRKAIAKEGFSTVYILRCPDEVSAARPVVRR